MSSAEVPDRGPAVFSVTTATLVLASSFVAARLGCRIGIVKHVSWDDYFIIIAWALAFAISLTIDIGTRKGLGRHDVDILPDDWDSLRRTEYVFSVLYNPALMACKTSILVFYLRLSRNTQKVLRMASWAVLAVVNVAGSALTLLNIFQCRPVQAAFDPYPYPAICIPLLAEFISSAPVNIVTDLAILALPLPVLTGMRLPQRQKVILILTFALGIFVTIVDVIRIYYLQQAITEVSPNVSSNPAATFGDSPQFAWNASLSLMWSAVEVNIGITCACIPTLKPLIVRVLPAMLVDPDGTRHRGSDSSDKPPISQLSYEHRNSEVTPVPNARLPSQDNPPSPSAAMSALEFLTTPDMNLDSPNAVRPPTVMTAGTATTAGGEASGLYFGFVNMRKPKSMIRTSTRDSFRYCTIVTVLFLLWGFTYGLLNILNNVVAQIAQMSVPETLGLTSVYFGAGYFFGPLLIGEWVLRHDEHSRSKKRHKRRSGAEDQIGGYKATFIIGLCIYGTGTIVFWPSAVLASFPGFLISNFLVGFGIAVLETAANPFLLLTGPLNYSEMRLLIAQGFQAVATVVSGLLAQKVFFINLDSRAASDSMTLLDVQWTYLAITLLCVALALFIYYMPLPEVTDTEMEHSTRYLPVDPKKRSLGGFQLRTCTLVLAVIAQWTYVAGQESMSIFFRDIITPAPSVASTNTGANGDTSEQSSDHPMGLTLSIPDYLLIAHTAFAVSRFLAAYLAYLSPTHPKVPQPRTILNISTGLSIASASVAVGLRPSNPNYLVVPIILFFFFEGPMWPLIFALGLRGQGKRTKRAAAFITMGGSGPAFWPFVIYGINVNGGSIQTAFSVVPALLVITGLFAVFLDLKRDAKALVDARVDPDEQSRIQDRANRAMDLDAIMAARRRSRSRSGIDHEKLNFIKRFSNVFGKGSGHGRHSADQVTTEHREAKGSNSE